MWKILPNENIIARNGRQRVGLYSCITFTESSRVAVERSVETAVRNDASTCRPYTHISVFASELARLYRLNKSLTQYLQVVKVLLSCVTPSQRTNTPRQVTPLTY